MECRINKRHSIGNVVTHVISLGGTMNTKEQKIEVNEMTGLPIFKMGGMTVEVNHDDSPSNPLEECDYEKSAFLHLKSYRNGNLEYLENSEEVTQDEAFIAIDEGEGVSRFDALLDLYGCPYEAGEAYKKLKSFTFHEVGDHRIDRRGVLGVKSEDITSKKGYTCTVEEYLESIEEEYGAWCAGEVYGYIIKSSDDDHIDSCWGFYGSEYCLKEGISVLECYIEPIKVIIKNIYKQLNNIDLDELSKLLANLGNEEYAPYLKGYYPTVIKTAIMNTLYYLRYS